MNVYVWYAKMERSNPHPQIQSAVVWTPLMVNPDGRDFFTGQLSVCAVANTDLARASLN